MTSEIQVLTLWGCHILITMFLPISFKNEYNEYVVSESLIVPCLNIKKKYDQRTAVNWYQINHLLRPNVLFTCITQAP
jgi:hypothetical protein